MDDSWDGSRRIDDPTGRTIRLDGFTLEAGYGLGGRWSAEISANYNRKSRTIELQAIDGQLQRFESVGSGFGDVIALLKYLVIQPNLLQPLAVSGGIGFQAPTGASEQTSDGVKLPKDLQPGTGAWALVSWGYIDRIIGNSPIRLAMNAAYIHPGPDRDGYRIGPEFNYAFEAGYSTSGPLDYILQFRGRVAGRDYFPERGKLPSTGGHLILFQPGIGVRVGGSLQFQAIGELPVYRAVNGIQLGPTNGLRIGVSHAVTI